MNRPRLPCPLFTALVAVAAPAHAWAALPPSSLLPADVPVEEIGDDVLAGQTGKYFGANMLVGVRVDLVSALHSSAGSAAASGSLLVMRDASGATTVQVDARSQAADAAAPTGAAGPTTITVTAAVPGTAAAPAAAPTTPALTTTADLSQALGGSGVQVDGIAQVAQIAGDNNRLGNTTTIRFVDSVAGTGFNGQTQASASTGTMTAQVSFDGGVHMDVGGPGAHLLQDVATDGSARIMQSGQLAGVGLTGSNQLQLQLVIGAMPTQLVHQLGIQQALSGLLGLTR